MAICHTTDIHHMSYIISRALDSPLSTNWWFRLIAGALVLYEAYLLLVSYGMHMR